MESFCASLLRSVAATDPIIRCKWLPADIGSCCMQPGLTDRGHSITILERALCSDTDESSKAQMEDLLDLRSLRLAQRLSTHRAVDMQDEYHALSYKTMALWRLVEDHFDIDYLINVDDDNFVRLDRLSLATHQWDEENAGRHSLDLMHSSVY